jgi:membrane protease YdiL (CAAX protease family)
MDPMQPPEMPPQEPGVPTRDPRAGLFDVVSPAALLGIALGCLILYQVAEVVFWNGRPGAGVWGLALSPVIGILLPVAVLVRGLRLSVRDELWLYGLPPRHLLGSVLVALGAAPIAYAASAFTAEYLPPDPQYVEMFRNLVPTNAAGYLGGFLSVVVLAPLGEEVIFRVLVLGVFCRHMPAAAAAVLSGLLFGAAHWAPWMLLPVSLLGIVLGFLTLSTGSIVSAWIGHAIFNLVAFVELLATGDAETPWLDQCSRRPEVLVVAVTLLVVGFRLIRRTGPESPQRTT